MKRTAIADIEARLWLLEDQNTKTLKQLDDLTTRLDQLECDHEAHKHEWKVITGPFYAPSLCNQVLCVCGKMMQRIDPWSRVRIRNELLDAKIAHLENQKEVDE